MSIDLIGGVLSGVLGTRRKRSGKALRFLTGNRGGLLSNPSTLLAAAGVYADLYRRQFRDLPVEALPATD